MRLKHIVIGLIVGILSGIAYFVYGFFTAASSTQGPTTTKTIVEIPKGSSLSQIQTLLYKDGVLKDAWRMGLLAKALGKDTSIKWGEFEFDKPSSPYDALLVLEKGKPVLKTLSIPEGKTVEEILNLIDESGLFKKEELAKMREALPNDHGFDTPANGPLEGFLFPETYHFSKGTSVRTILKEMIEHFKMRALTKDNQKMLAKSNLSLPEWVTLASIIEKETGQASEYPLIASVFANRLKRGMRLQSDPTVIYGMKNYQGNIQKKHLTQDTPYNTYTRKGLPIGPICNPGLGALNAALRPEKTNFLYFVAKGDGTHVFSKTYQEHQKAVARFQLRRRRNYRSY